MDYVRDASDIRVNVGDRVRVGDDLATILSISDPDGDVDDEGRGISIPPYVQVKFEGGDQESDQYSCYSQAQWHDEDPNWRCDDIEKF